MTDPINQEHEDVLNFAHSLPSGLTQEQIYVRIHERAAKEAAARVDAAIAAHNEAVSEQERIAAELSSCRAAAAAGLPAGWKAVPIEPTLAMVAALGWEGDEDLAIGHAQITSGLIDSYKALLAASPALPADPVDESQPAAVAQLKKERDQFERMFLEACTDLGLINEYLGLDPDDGGAEPIIGAIQELKAKLVAPVPAAQEGQGWTKNTGARPVADGVWVQVEVRDGQTIRRDAGRLDWSIEDVPGDILRWRLAPAMEAQSHE